MIFFSFSPLLFENRQNQKVCIARCMHGILPSLIKMCLTSNYLFVWGFSLKTANVSENINKHNMFFTLKFQLEKYRARAQQCSFAQHDRYLTQLGRLTAPVRAT